MYWTTIESIGIPFLHDAAMVCAMRGYDLRSIYVDPDGRCAISYWGTLDIFLAASILQEYLPYKTFFEEIIGIIEENPTRYYECFDEEDPRHPEGYTTIYTPDDIDYRDLRL